MSDKPNLSVALATMRLSLAAFFLVWSLEKVLAPEVARRVFTTFYLVDLPNAAYLAVGLGQTLVVLAFAAGLWKAWTYGALLLMHAVSTLSTFGRLIDPYEPPNHLFWAAVPVLGALVALFLLRREDRLMTVDAARAGAPARAS